MTYNPEHESRLIDAALAIVSHRNAETHTLPGASDDAERELNESRLIHYAREYVEHTKDIEVMQG